jgi:hypothetical protein
MGGGLMTETKEYIDTGDRIVVKDVTPEHNGFGSTSLKEHHLGMHGIVSYNDGWGHCRVLLDNGDEVSCWNGKHLEYEEKGS